ncbi:MAG: hypothetical protein J2P31_10455, partial [Blastocatellia bacterium]|nr:hypothetical protein [Blastocatellia bacterium]
MDKKTSSSLVSTVVGTLLLAAAVPIQSRPAFSQSDQAFLEDLSHRAFSYFWEQADPRTGLVRDRSKVDGEVSDEAHANVASIAATGFGLTGLCIAAEHKWIKREEARERVRA